MALNIKDSATDHLARQLAAETGESITVATRIALEERLTRVRSRLAVSRRALDLGDIIGRGRARTILDPRTTDEIMGYDGAGLPQ